MTPERWAQIRAIAWSLAAAIAIAHAIRYESDPTVAVCVVFIGAIALMIGEARRG